ncbi:hydrogenase maturation protease [Vibrio sp. S11_S32]|uniref:HyaD/HybD family hydrogenase maturation endopeptidase n=1 Tax=Vibrio sp. S11_S32 TaxID=2720225 RepID=UPI0016805E65|nr:HyaD/HybD family hydrogenase maturation endopeptidase [Vibrio sp. S11_S32]MBD1577159.1 hydrogenase maturation protease [Vibrio sp. S11_S32]
MTNSAITNDHSGEAKPACQSSAQPQDSKHFKSPKRILLLGIGNILYGDEGIGVHFINYIADKYTIVHPEHEFDIVDGGTLAHGLIPMLATYDDLIVVDTVNSADGQFGDVYFFDFDHAPPEVDWQGSAHEVEMLQTLIMMEMVGDRPHTFVLGVIPTVIEPMFMGLTSAIYRSVPTMEKQLLQHLTSLGFSCTVKQAITIDTVIPDAQKR